MKCILITGKDSYIGTSLENWLMREPDKYKVDTVDMKDESWKGKDFSKYDVVFHVAGIAHVSSDSRMEDLYYKVNRDLTIETAAKSKIEGVKQFVFMSSIIVYGDSNINKSVIDKSTIPIPTNFYGNSKLQAEEGIRHLESDNFKIVVLRPPMIYGKGSKGNYPRLANLAKKIPVFPDIDNERSMLHIDNLCEFIKGMIDIEESGLFFPQNKEYVNTSELVKTIAEVHCKKILMTRIFNPALRLVFGIGIVNKVFGNLVYEKSMSDYDKANYQIRTFKESIELTEIGNKYCNKVLFLVNHDLVIYNFRKELVERLLSDGHQVIISSPYGERIDDLVKMGCKYIEAKIERHGTNPLNDLKLLSYYNRLMRDVKPDVVLTYTIKPNIYGGLAAKKLKIPYIANITGLGTAVEKKSIIQQITIILYKLAFANIQRVFFQNEENMKFFRDNNIVINKHRLLPGSGVNLDHFQVLDYPSDDTTEFAFISRIMKEKGIDQYIQVAEYITKKYPNVKFHVCGFCEEAYEGTLYDLQNKGILTYHGMIRDIRDILKKTHCTIHPTYYPEGLSNVLLESAASGRPIITTDRSGCREVVDQGINGFMIKQKDSNDLIGIVEKFLDMKYDDKKKMGLNGRKKVVEEFDRQIVVNAYIEEIEIIINQSNV